jgi:peptidoglycan hydrolase-like protein with peptidoglycan-binding domain
VGSISRKTVAWVSGAALVVAGGTAGVVLAVQGGSGNGGQAAAAARVAATPPLKIVSISPANGTQNANGAGTVTVTYDRALPASTPLPTLSPAVAGSWQREGKTVVFTPAKPIAQGTMVMVSVPATQEGGIRTDATSSFTTGHFSTLRMQQILAQLGYLPLKWTPAAGATVPAGTAAAQLSAAYAPPKGTFTWEAGYPSQLHSFWDQGQSNTLTRGAIYGFQADHNLTIDGNPTAKVWTALLAAATADQKNTHGYSYAIASKSSPETLTIWHNGSQVFHSLANTGISVAPTAAGTYPVYLKYPFQVMSGTNPDGSHYSDPVSYVSYFNGGDAVHYFNRGSYGWPQSLGCVELPMTAAKQAYPNLPYGTLVTVS